MDLTALLFGAYETKPRMGNTFGVLTLCLWPIVWHTKCIPNCKIPSFVQVGYFLQKCRKRVSVWTFSDWKSYPAAWYHLCVRTRCVYVKVTSLEWLRAWILFVQTILLRSLRLMPSPHYSSSKTSISSMMYIYLARLFQLAIVWMETDQQKKWSVLTLTYWHRDNAIHDVVPSPHTYCSRIPYGIVPD